MQEKGSRQHPLSDAAKESNGERARTGSRVEHVFAQMALSMGGEVTHCIWFSQGKILVVFTESHI